MKARGARRERTPHLPQRVPLLQRGSATRRNIRRGDVRDLLTHRDGAERKRIFSEERRGRRISYMAGRRGLYTSALLRDPSPARPHPAKYKSASRSSRARSMQISAESPPGALHHGPVPEIDAPPSRQRAGCAARRYVYLAGPIILCGHVVHSASVYCLCGAHIRGPVHYYIA